MDKIKIQGKLNLKWKYKDRNVKTHIFEFVWKQDWKIITLLVLKPLDLKEIMTNILVYFICYLEWRLLTFISNVMMK